MKTGLIAGLLLAGLSAGSVMAAPPTGEQKAEFYKTCMGIAQDETLCSCKAEATTDLIDSAFMTIVISSMQGQALAAEYYVPYNAYVAHSNQVCKPNY